MVDSRDETTWVAVELSPQGEIRVTEGTLEAALRRDLNIDEDHPVFIPCAHFRRDGRLVTVHLMEGYVFVASGLPETAYFSLERHSYVSQVLSNSASRSRMRTLSVVPDSKIREMKSRLQVLVSSEIGEGDQVTVTDGTYQNLTGRVVGVEGENAFVHIKLRSLEVVATVPRFFLVEDQQP